MTLESFTNSHEDRVVEILALFPPTESGRKTFISNAFRYPQQNVKAILRREETYTNTHLDGQRPKVNTLRAILNYTTMSVLCFTTVRKDWKGFSMRSKPTDV